MSSENDEYLFDIARLRGSLVEYSLRTKVATGDDPAERVAAAKGMYRARRAFARPMSYPQVLRPEWDWDMDDVSGDAAYTPCPEAYPDYSRVRRGSVKSFRDWVSKSGSDGVYPGIKRDFYVYLPQQLTSEDMEPALLLCLDGAGYTDRNGAVRACAVLDSLIDSGELPVTVGVFVMPGRPVDCPSQQELLTAVGGDLSKFEEDPRAALQRQIEYDRVTDDFPRFIEDELLPFVREYAGVERFTSDSRQRCMAGCSSGGIASFNAAWHRPHSWGRVLSHCGSFVALNGGQNYPYIVRRSDRKEREHLRVVLTSGSRDMDNGEWRMGYAACMQVPTLNVCARLCTLLVRLNRNGELVARQPYDGRRAQVCGLRLPLRLRQRWARHAARRRAIRGASAVAICTAGAATKGAAIVFPAKAERTHIWDC